VQSLLGSGSLFVRQRYVLPSITHIYQPEPSGSQALLCCTGSAELTRGTASIRAVVAASATNPPAYRGDNRLSPRPGSVFKRTFSILLLL